MNTASGALSTLRRISIAIAIAILFVFGLATTVYLSLRSPEVKVPDVMGKDRFEAERVLGSAGLNFRVRATRPSQLKADTVLFQLPRGGEVVKAAASTPAAIPSKAYGVARRSSLWQMNEPHKGFRHGSRTRGIQARS